MTERSLNVNELRRERASGSRRWIAAGACVCLVWVAMPHGLAQAGLLADCDDAMTGWHGTVSSSYTFGSDTLAVDLDYAVFDAGDYPGDDPSGGSAYVYAYQAFNKSQSTVGVVALSVGLAADSDAANIGDDTSAEAPGETGGVWPDVYNIGTSSALWGFGWQTGGEIPPDAHSTVLLFTSPNPPEWNSATTTDGGLPVPCGELPSPVPEPMVSILLAAGAAALLKRRRM